MLLILLVLSTWTTLGTATCYMRNGTEITDIAYQPCYNGTTHASACCGTNHQGAGETNVANDVCESNGLCQNFEGLVGNEAPAKMWWRQGCTDQTWESPYCLANVCNIDPWKNDNAPVRSCADGRWCCGDESCCNVSASLFALAATVGPTATSSSSASSTSKISSASTTASAAQTTAQPSRTATSILSTPLSTDARTFSSGFPTAAKIGLGVGLPVLILLLGIILALLWMLKKRRKTKTPMTYEKADDNEYYAYRSAPVELDSNALPAEVGGTPRAELTGGEVAILIAENSRKQSVVQYA